MILADCCFCCFCCLRIYRPIVAASASMSRNKLTLHFDSGIKHTPNGVTSSRTACAATPLGLQLWKLQSDGLPRFDHQRHVHESHRVRLRSTSVVFPRAPAKGPDVISLATAHASIGGLLCCSNVPS